jgi:hypothetical protein
MQTIASTTTTKVINDEVLKMLKECVLEPSRSSCSLVVLVMKKDGITFVCVDCWKPIEFVY